MFVNGLYILLSFFIGFVIGAPILLSVAYFYLSSYAKSVPKKVKDETKEIEDEIVNEMDLASNSSDSTPITKVGWLRIKSQDKAKSSSSSINSQANSGLNSPDSATPVPQPYFTGLINSGLSLLEKKSVGPPPVNKRQKDEYFCVLKTDQLMLYESPKRTECRGVILLSQYTVSIYPAGLADHQIFRKEHPILLRFRVNPNDSNTSSGSNEKVSLNGTSKDASTSGISNFITGKDYFIYVDSPVLKESWFVSLLNGSKGTSKGNYGEPLAFDRSALETLLENLNQSESHLKTQWFNGFLGRIFLGVYKTQTMKDFLITKISSKLAKIKTPTFLGPIHVRDIHVGDSLPQFTNLKLLELNENGEFSGQMDMSYFGGFRVEIETEATISVSARLKPLKVNLVLALMCNSISGQMLIKIKPPPSNRVWVGFYHTPNLDLKIEPIVQETHLKFSVIVQAIQRRIMDLLNESMVLPNMEDYPFFPSFGTGESLSSLETKITKPIDPNSSVNDPDSKLDLDESNNKLNVDKINLHENKDSKASKSSAHDVELESSENIEADETSQSDKEKSEIFRSHTDPGKLPSGSQSINQSNSQLEPISKTRSLFSKSNMEQLSSTASSINSRLTTIGASYLSSFKKNNAQSQKMSPLSSASTNNLLDLKQQDKEGLGDKEISSESQNLFKKYNIKTDSKLKTSMNPSQSNIIIDENGIIVETPGETRVLNATSVESIPESNVEVPTLTIPPSAEHKPLSIETNETHNHSNTDDPLMTDHLMLNSNPGFSLSNNNLSPPPPAATSLSTSAENPQRGRRHSNANSVSVDLSRDNSGTSSHSRNRSMPLEIPDNEEESDDISELKLSQPPLPIGATSRSAADEHSRNHKSFLSSWSGVIHQNSKSTLNTLRTRYNAHQSRKAMTFDPHDPSSKESTTPSQSL
ncbi:hypothetical protein CONCODRAFT_80813 [Conidiobolus coronatus NRRL 28638]|uniref:SMP-LTD domain-containing protein n=1 Tax=Conidiobolus coronatus (strain ATCC 28846 / CBS 209.66 / NRRL 28638) TaxID=796925 RepID=A0A137NRC4_CONC2|nr:hypothetical protein CONCODRAFT_80813 [Conidiobolus coronatus NRRL 28638]|eukprot:KXN65278.1 hypothetical protein CONCODRAFT_80813 [Conidiobolus coronatus NRRL 28638]